MKHKLLILFFALLWFSACKKDDDNNCGQNATCFTCENCQGQYGHLINGEYCVDGYDNCEDWEAAKTHYETNDGCDCQYTK